MANKKTSEKSTGTDQDKPETDKVADIEQSQADASEVTEAAADVEPDRDDPDQPDTVDDGDAPVDVSDNATAPDSAQDKDDAAHTEDDSQAAPSAPPVATEQVVIRKGGFFPTLLGGAVAAAIGFGVSQYMGNDWPFADNEPAPQFTALQERLDAQNTKLASLQDRLDQAPDVAGLKATQDDLASQLSGLEQEVGQMASQLAGLDDRLTEVEKRPVSEAASDAAVAAYERELKALQDSMAQQRAEIEAMARDARAMEQSAEETAQATMRRAAVTRIQTALDSGTGFAPALADLEAAGAKVPQALRSAASAGVPTLAALQDSFPEAARRALRVARGASDSDGGGVGSFLRDQLGVRSLTPKEGNDPDAVLSRAEAAVGDGRLQDTLAELEALPEAGRAELADWSEQAKQRLDAVSAAEALIQDMN